MGVSVTIITSGLKAVNFASRSSLLLTILLALKLQHLSEHIVESVDVIDFKELSSIFTLAARYQLMATTWHSISSLRALHVFSN